MGDRIRLACACGATLQGSASPPAVADWLTEAFWYVHADAGHGPCSLRVAYNARRRIQRALQRERTR